jgi:hypothetical protein
MAEWERGDTNLLSFCSYEQENAQERAIVQHLERDRWYKSSQQTIKKEGVVMARLTEEQIANIERQADLAERKAAAEAKLAAQQPAWRIKEQQAQKDYYARMNQAHEQAMQRKRGFIESNPGSYSPWEKQAVDKYFKDKVEEEQRIADNEHRANELETREDIAEAQRDGQIGAGRDAAQIRADAEKYTSDNRLKGIQSQAEAQREIEKGKIEAEKWIAGRKTESAETISRNEHGYFDADGTYHPGSDVHSAKEQGNWKSAIETQKQKGRETLQEMKGDQKIRAEQMKQVFGIVGRILNKDGNYKMQDAEKEAERLGISKEALRGYFKEMGINQDNEEEQTAKVTVATQRQNAVKINRF